METAFYAFYAVLSLCVVILTTGVTALLVVFILEVKKDISRSMYTFERPSVHREKPEEVGRLATLLKETQEKVAPTHEKDGPTPMAYCGHCGKSIFSEVVEALDVGDLAVVAHECPACKKRTLLPQEARHEDG